MIKRVLLSVLSSILAMVLVAMPVLASSALGLITITEASGNGYSYLPIIATIGNTGLISAGSLTASGRDAYVLMGGSGVKRMVRDTATNFVATSVSPSTNTYAQYTGGNTAENFSIIPGYGGYVTTTDAAALEPGNSFEVDLNDIYVKTDSTNVGNDIFSKSGALRCYVSSAGNVTAAILADASITQNTTDSPYSMYSGSAIRVAQKFTTFTGTITSMTYYVKKVSSPTGTLSCMIRDATTDAILATSSTTYDVASLTGSYVAKSFPFSYAVSATTIRVSLEYASTSSNSSNYVDVSYRQSNVVASTLSLYVAAWSDSGSSYDLQFILAASTETKSATRACATGEHDLIVYADAVNLNMIVDGVGTQIALAGASVPDNANNWIWFSNAVPYIGSIEVWVSSTRIVNYTPTSYIVSTTLPDSEGAAQNGTFTYGTNPSGVTATFAAGVINCATLAATNVSSSTATLNGTLFSMGSYAVAGYFFEYGETTSYGKDTTPTSALYEAQQFSKLVSGLKPNTTYHYRAGVAFADYTVYGSDMTFTTSVTGAEEASDTITIHGAKVFKNYLTNGDLLFVMYLSNTYTGYYPDKPSNENFTIQLIGTDHTTVIAATPLKQWGSRPSSVYLNPSVVTASITELSEYYLKCVFNSNSAVNDEYQLSQSDWKGADLTKLDDWIYGTVIQMEYADNMVNQYHSGRTDGTFGLTDVGGGFFTLGIPGIAQKRPDIFGEGKSTNPFDEGTADNQYDAAHVYGTEVGGYIEADTTVLGNMFSISNKDFAAFVLLGIICFIVIGVAGGGGSVVPALLCCLPLLFAGNELGVISGAITIVAIIIGIYIFARQFIVKVW